MASRRGASLPFPALWAPPTRDYIHAHYPNPCQINNQLINRPRTLKVQIQPMITFTQCDTTFTLFMDGFLNLLRKLRASGSNSDRKAVICAAFSRRLKDGRRGVTRVSDENVKRKWHPCLVKATKMVFNAIFLDKNINIYYLPVLVIALFCRWQNWR